MGGYAAGCVYHVADGGAVGAEAHRGGDEQPEDGEIYPGGIFGVGADLSPSDGVEALEEGGVGVE